MKREPTLQTRRKFLRTSVLGAAASWTLPVFIEKTFFVLNALATDAITQTVTGKDGTILVVLQLAGGNDGLNTVIPFAEDNYHRVRPKLALPSNKVLKLDFYVGLNPRLTGLKTLHDSGELAIVQGVGYPNPNRSHFRSTEIWQTASDANQFLGGRRIIKKKNNCCSGAKPTVGVTIGEQLPEAFNANIPTGVAIGRPGNLGFDRTSD